MQKETYSLEEKIKSVVKDFLEKTNDKEIYLVSHFDTDGITSATIMIQTLKKIDRKFSVKIVKSLDKEFIDNLPKNKIILFLDLGSGSLNQLKDSGLKDVFIIDHHEIVQKVPENVSIVNPELHNKQKISGSGLTYLFCKEIDSENQKFAKLAILGMIGDYLEKEVGKLNNGILEDGEIIRKRGLLIYPSTRPINKVLEFSSTPYIPDVTGNVQGVLDLLRETGITPRGGRYPNLIELNDEEMEKLVTGIMLRNPKAKNKEIVGDVFLIKFFNKLEDARELSAMINACSRLGESQTALQLCLEIPSAKKRAETIHAKYKQFIISGLKFIEETEKISGKDFVIINAKNNIKDTIAGTLASILSNSLIYEEGTIITTMAFDEDKNRIKVSSRIVGKNGRNAREILQRVVDEVGGEVGGHECAAGCTIPKDKEKQFIELLKKNLEIELVKI